IDAAIEGVRPAAMAKDIRVVKAIHPGVHPIRGDAQRLQQVAWNLLSNAINFTPENGRVELRLRPAGTYLELTVRDTGKGISPAFLPHVFERFRQGDASSRGTHGGLGLGLAIVRHIVELHGGTVHAESAGEGQGATFTVRLPVQVASRQAPARSPETEPPPAPARLGGRPACVRRTARQGRRGELARVLAGATGTAEGTAWAASPGWSDCHCVPTTLPGRNPRDLRARRVRDQGSARGGGLLTDAGRD